MIGGAKGAKKKKSKKEKREERIEQALQAEEERIARQTAATDALFADMMGGLSVEEFREELAASGADVNATVGAMGDVERQEAAARRAAEAEAAREAAEQQALEDNAASRLQAAERGRAARKQMRKQQQAATRIQAVHRGKVARGELEAAKEVEKFSIVDSGKRIYNAHFKLPSGEQSAETDMCIVLGKDGDELDVLFHDGFPQTIPSRYLVGELSASEWEENKPSPELVKVRTAEAQLKEANESKDRGAIKSAEANLMEVKEAVMEGKDRSEIYEAHWYALDRPPNYKSEEKDHCIVLSRGSGDMLVVMFSNGEIMAIPHEFVDGWDTGSSIEEPSAQGSDEVLEHLLKEALAETEGKRKMRFTVDEYRGQWSEPAPESIVVNVKPSSTLTEVREAAASGCKRPNGTAANLPSQGVNTSPLGWWFSGGGKLHELVACPHPNGDWKADDAQEESVRIIKYEDRLTAEMFGMDEDDAAQVEAKVRAEVEGKLKEAGEMMAEAAETKKSAASKVSELEVQLAQAQEQVEEEEEGLSDEAESELRHQVEELERDKASLQQDLLDKDTAADDKLQRELDEQKLNIEKEHANDFTDGKAAGVQEAAVYGQADDPLGRVPKLEKKNVSWGLGSDAAFNRADYNAEQVMSAIFEKMEGRQDEMLKNLKGATDTAEEQASTALKELEGEREKTEKLDTQLKEQAKKALVKGDRVQLDLNTADPSTKEVTIWNKAHGKLAGAEHMPHSQFCLGLEKKYKAGLVVEEMDDKGEVSVQFDVEDEGKPVVSKLVNVKFDWLKRLNTQDLITQAMEKERLIIKDGVEKAHLVEWAKQQESIEEQQIVAALNSVDPKEALKDLISEADKAKKGKEKDAAQRAEKAAATISSLEEQVQMLEADAKIDLRLESALDEYAIARVRATFDVIDEDGSGSLDRGEVVQLLERLDAQPTKVELARLADMNKNSDGEVSVDEFLKWWGAREPEGGDDLKIKDHLLKVINSYQELIEQGKAASPAASSDTAAALAKATDKVKAAVEQLEVSGDEYMAAGKYAEAISIWKAASDLDPENVNLSVPIQEAELAIAAAAAAEKKKEDEEKGAAQRAAQGAKEAEEKILFLEEKVKTLTPEEMKSYISDVMTKGDKEFLERILGENPNSVSESTLEGLIKIIADTKEWKMFMVDNEENLKLQISNEINNLFNSWVSTLSPADRLGLRTRLPRYVEIAGKPVEIPGGLDADRLGKAVETAESTAGAGPEPATGGGRKSPRTLKKNKNKRKSPRTLKKNKNKRNSPRTLKKNKKKKKNTVKQRRRSVKKKH